MCFVNGIHIMREGGERGLGRGGYRSSVIRLTGPVDFQGAGGKYREGGGAAAVATYTMGAAFAQQPEVFGTPGYLRYTK